MPTRVRYSIVTSTTLVAVLLYLDRNCISMIAKDDDFRSAFGIGQEGAFAVMAMFYLAYALAQVPAGWLADRYGARKMMTGYVLLWSACTIMTGLAGGLMLLLASRFLFGLAQAGCYPTSGSLIKRWMPLGARGKASSCVSMGGRIGGVIAPALTGLLLFRYMDWRQVLVLYGVFGLLVAADYWRTIRETPAEHPQCNQEENELVIADGGEDSRKAPPFPPIKALIFNASMWRMCLMQFCVNVGWVFLVTGLPDYLKIVHHQTSE